ncbi:MAG TPA: hypothetical protein VFT98_18520 [Myxococcota bacterium]|nr:hypothetical protein [Myxococcota bacterium]
MNLESALADESLSIDALGEELDRAPAGERRAAVLALGRAAQRRIYRLAEEARPLALEDFVPAERAPRESVRHFGKNTLPLPGSLRFFEKRFSRPESGPPRLFGYNETPVVRWVGPGYFVAVTTAGQAAWEARGAVVVDYFRVPDGPVPSGWPPVVPNSHGLQVFVYHRTRDFMRRVSRHVTIGAAYKGERPLDHYFVLVREE